jgi:23S rRNA A2030 N6-methylase RlmJ
VKDDAAVDRFTAELKNAHIGKMTQLSLDVGGDEGLRDCAVIAINAPWTLENEWREPLAWLAQHLARGTAACGAITVLSSH